MFPILPRIGLLSFVTSSPTFRRAPIIQQRLLFLATSERFFSVKTPPPLTITESNQGHQKDKNQGSTRATDLTAVQNYSQYHHEDHSLPGRYATALYRVCMQKGVLENVWSDLESLRSCLTESNDFRIFLETPGISVRQKVQLISIISKQFSLGEVTTNLLNLLVENRRLPYLRKIVDSFENFYRASRGEVKCLVSSATLLTDNQKENIEKALRKRNPQDRLMISFAVTPSLLGGLVVRLGDQTLDYSVASRLAALQSQLLVPVSH